MLVFGYERSWVGECWGWLLGSSSIISIISIHMLVARNCARRASLSLNLAWIPSLSDYLVRNREVRARCLRSEEFRVQVKWKWNRGARCRDGRRFECSGLCRCRIEASCILVQSRLELLGRTNVFKQESRCQWLFLLLRLRRRGHGIWKIAWCCCWAPDTNIKREVPGHTRGLRYRHLGGGRGGQAPNSSEVVRGNVRHINKN